MATYQLNATDLLTLLASTVTADSEGLILKTLIDAGSLTGPVETTAMVQVEASGISGGGAITDTVANGVKFDLISIPTTTSISGSTFPTPTAGAIETPYTIYDLTTSGGVVLAAGDQSAHLNDLGPGGDTLIGGAGFERLHTTTGANMLVAGSGQNTLVGGAGADTLVGGGDTRLVAGTGNTTLIGGTIAGAQDTLVGSSGNDTLSVVEGNNRLVDNFGSNWLQAGSGNDTLIGGGTSSLMGGTGDARLIARGDDTLTGGTGSDTMLATGAATAVTFVGGSGFSVIADRPGVAATITGGSGGEHVVLGKGGDDSILGGSGAMSILSLHSDDDLVSNSSTAVGGLHTLTFSDGQVITINDANSNITIHFNGGGTTTV